MPRVSVILNSYNQGQYLGEAIESVLAQRFGDFELLVIDNGSTDQSHELAKRYAAQDQRIKLFLHDRNISLSARQNEGVKRASGEFVSFLYSDDLYLPHKLERQVALLSSLPPDWGVVYAPARGLNVLTGGEWIHPCLHASGYVLPTMIRDFERGHVDMLSPLTRRPLLERYPFFEELFAEGEAVYMRIAMTAKFQFDPEPVVVLREHDRNIGKAIRRNHENFLGMLDRLERHPDFPRELLSDAEDLRARVARDSAWQALRMGSTDMAWVRERFRFAARLRPRLALHPRLLMGVPLSLLPGPVRRRVNAVGLRLRGHKANASYREEF
jgi:glycosyltransferase involved in cell wall biosynthesis